MCLLGPAPEDTREALAFFLADQAWLLQVPLLFSLLSRSPAFPIEHMAADSSSFLLELKKKKKHAISNDSKPSRDSLCEVYSDREHARTFLIKFFSAST